MSRLLQNGKAVEKRQRIVMAQQEISWHTLVCIKMKGYAMMYLRSWSFFLPYLVYKTSSHEIYRANAAMEFISFYNFGLVKKVFFEECTRHSWPQKYIY